VPLLAAALCACAKGDSGPGGARAEHASPATAAGRPGVTPTLSDANILAAMDQANLADSLMGAIAAAKGTHGDVRSFGRNEASAHHAMRRSGRELAERLHVVPEIQAGDTTAVADRALADSLRTLAAGTAWDRFYLASALLHHENELAALQTGRAETQSLDLAARMGQDSAAVDAHRDLARSIQQRVAGLVMARVP
jgi:predicted outer membrane protein